MTDMEPQTAEEAEVAADEVEAPAQNEFIEFVGWPPYGTEFYSGEAGTHTVTRAQLKEAADIDLGTKEVVWKRGQNGRFLVSTNDLSPEVVEYLANDPAFKLVTL